MSITYKGSVVGHIKYKNEFVDKAFIAYQDHPIAYNYQNIDKVKVLIFKF